MQTDEEMRNKGNNESTKEEMAEPRKSPLEVEDKTYMNSQVDLQDWSTFYIKNKQAVPGESQNNGSVDHLKMRPYVEVDLNELDDDFTLLTSTYMSEPPATDGGQPSMSNGEVEAVMVAVEATLSHLGEDAASLSPHNGAQPSHTSDATYATACCSLWRGDMTANETQNNAINLQYSTINHPSYRHARCFTVNQTDHLPSRHVHCSTINSGGHPSSYHVNHSTIKSTGHLLSTSADYSSINQDCRSSISHPDCFLSPAGHTSSTSVNNYLINPPCQPSTSPINLITNPSNYPIVNPTGHPPSTISLDPYSSETRAIPASFNSTTHVSNIDSSSTHSSSNAPPLPICIPYKEDINSHFSSYGRSEQQAQPYCSQVTNLSGTPEPQILNCTPTFGNCSSLASLSPNNIDSIPYSNGGFLDRRNARSSPYHVPNSGTLPNYSPKGCSSNNDSTSLVCNNGSTYPHFTRPLRKPMIPSLVSNKSPSPVSNSTRCPPNTNYPSIYSSVASSSRIDEDISVQPFTLTHNNNSALTGGSLVQSSTQHLPQTPLSISLQQNVSTYTNTAPSSANIVTSQLAVYSSKMPSPSSQSPITSFSTSSSMASFPLSSSQESSNQVIELVSGETMSNMFMENGNVNNVTVSIKITAGINDQMPSRYISDTTEATCNVCGVICASAVHLQQHLKGHNVIYEFLCLVCNCTFSQRSILVKHMVAVHKVEPEQIFFVENIFWR